MADYRSGTGRLAVDRYEFKNHVDGSSLKHNAPSVLLTPTVTIGGTPVTDVQSAIQTLNSNLTTIGSDLVAVSGGQNVIGLTGVAGVVTVSATEFYLNKGLKISAHKDGTSTTDIEIVGCENSFAGQSGGAISITAGVGLNFGGDLNLTAGLGMSEGGHTSLSAGSGFVGGDLSLTAGLGSGEGGQATLSAGGGVVGGDASVRAGLGEYGGSVNISAGDGTTSGGNVNITPGNNGGSLYLNSAPHSGANAAGTISLIAGNSEAATITLSEVTTDKFVISLAGFADSTKMPAGTGSGVVYLNNAAVTPTANPTGGAEIYSYAGNTWIRSSSGYEVQLANPFVLRRSYVADGLISSYHTYYDSVKVLAAEIYTAQTIDIPADSSFKVKAVITGMSAAPGITFNYEVEARFHRVSSDPSILDVTGYDQIVNKNVIGVMSNDPEFTLTGDTISFNLPSSNPEITQCFYTLEVWQISGLIP